MRFSKPSFRWAMLAGTTLLIDGTPFIQALATEAGDAVPATEIEDVTVTGTREAQRRAIGEKLSAPGIVDSIAQDDIGQLPDNTVVEAARRIPGVSVDLLTDNTRGRSEVQRASIRGFDAKYNTVTIDGSPIASIDSASLTNGLATRAQSLNLLPSTLISRTDVYKTITAENDPNALGGDIDLVTFSALRTKDSFSGNVSVFGGIDSSSGASTTATTPSDRENLILSNRWEGNSGKLGVVFSADHQQTFSASNGVTENVPGAASQTGNGWIYYNGVKPSITPTGTAVPERLDVYSFDTKLVHYSVSGKVEYENENGFKTNLFAGDYHQNSDETRNEVLTTPSTALINTGTNVTFQTANSGIVKQSDGQIGITRQPLTQQTEFLNWKNSYDLTNDLVLRFSSAYSISTAELYRNMVKFTTGGSADTSSSNMGYAFDDSTFIPSISLLNPGYLADASNFQGNYWRYITTDQKNQVIDLHPSIDWNDARDAQGLGGKIGAEWTETHMSYFQNYIQYNPTAAALKVGTAPTLAQALLHTGLTIPSWGGISMPLINLTAANALLTPGLATGLFAPVAEGSNDQGVDYAVAEQTMAGYVMGAYNSDNLHYEAGLRLERTRDSFASFNLPAPNDYVWSGQGSNYVSVLPSTQIKYDVLDDLIAHAGFSKTIGRPDWSSYTPLNRLTSTPTGPANSNSGAITQGNANIRPRKTDNYDMALDWYFQDFKSLLSVAYFYKKLTNEFYSLAYLAPYTFNGATYNSTYTQTRNGATAGVNGVELNLQIDHLDILPPEFGSIGLGVNGTVLSTSETIYDPTGVPRKLHDLINQPSDIMNASLFYTLGDFGAALSYSRQGNALYQTGRYAWEDTYIKPRGQLDLSMRYQVAAGLTAIFEASNITRAPFVSVTGPNRSLSADQYAIGATLWGGLNYKF